jgi:ribosome-associated protein
LTKKVSVAATKKVAPTKKKTTVKKATAKKAVADKKKAPSKKASAKKAAIKKPAQSTARKKSSNITTDVKLQQLHDVIVSAALDKKAIDIVSYDLRGINDAVADYFIICSGQVNTQIRSIATHIQDEVKKSLNEKPWHSEGFENLEWVIVDFVNVVVHIFNPSAREFYQLEELWSDADKKEFK